MGANSSKSTPTNFSDIGESRSSTSGNHSVVMRSRSAPNANEDSIQDMGLRRNAELKRRSTLVVVNQGKESCQDPLLIKLEELNFFYPLIHDMEKWSDLFSPHKRKALADIQSKIDSLPALKIVRIYEDKLKEHAATVSMKQISIVKDVRETDRSIKLLLKGCSERAKITAKNIDKFSKLDDLKRNLTKCQESLNECVAVVDLLNEMLPETERMEPIGWAHESSESSECIEHLVERMQL